MPKLESIEVRKGDFNSKYLNLMGYDEAHNRILREEHAKKLIKVWDKVQGSLVELVEEDGRFLIINGQHRIYAASTYLNGHTSRFDAVIYSREELAARGIDLVEHTANANAGKAQTVNDLLAMYQERSVWRDTFEEHGLKPEVKQASGTLTWANIIRAHVAVRRSLAIQRFYSASSSSVTRQTLLEEWQNTPDEEVRAAAFLVKWWLPAAQKAKEERKVLSLFSANALYAGFIIYHSNYTSPIINDAPERLADWAELPNVVRWAKQGHARQMTEAALYGMNFKRTTNVLTVFGMTGREGR